MASQQIIRGTQVHLHLQTLNRWIVASVESQQGDGRVRVQGHLGSCIIRKVLALDSRCLIFQDDCGSSDSCQECDAAMNLTIPGIRFSLHTHILQLSGAGLPEFNGRYLIASSSRRGYPEYHKCDASNRMCKLVSKNWPNTAEPRDVTYKWSICNGDDEYYYCLITWEMAPHCSKVPCDEGSVEPCVVGCKGMAPAPTMWCRVVCSKCKHPFGTDKKSHVCQKPWVAVFPQTATDV